MKTNFVPTRKAVVDMLEGARGVKGEGGGARIIDVPERHAYHTYLALVPENRFFPGFLNFHTLDIIGPSPPKISAVIVNWNM